MKKIERGEIYAIDLIEKDNRGNEIGKKRPGIIIQDNSWDFNSPTTIIVPLTSSAPRYGSAVTVSFKSGESGLHKDSTVVFREIKSVDKSRVGKRVGRVTEGKMQEIDRVLSLIIGLEPIE